MMKRYWKQVVMAIVMLVSLTALIAPAGAQAASAASRTITVTESQINSSFRVTNPVSRRWTNLSVDLQPGQAVLNGTLTLRMPAGQGTTAYAVSSIWTPYISNGRIYWTLVSATANGAPASSDLLAQINSSISSSWRNYVRSQTPGHVTGIVVTDTELQVTIN